MLRDRYIRTVGIEGMNYLLQNNMMQHVALNGEI